MSDRWVPARREAFVRDFVRDYCQVFLILAEQARRFEHDGSMSHSGLRELMGEAMRKGVFWRLKDTAHHLFRASPDVGETGTLPADWRFAASPHPSGDARQRPVEALLDWCVGYAFHECAKLKEDAFQRQHYGNRLMQLGRSEGVSAAFYTPLADLADQTMESANRELQRILHVLRHGMALLPSFLEGQGDNRALARWLAREERQARDAFGEQYDSLLRALYGDTPQRLPLLAARELLEAGRSDEALALLEEADGRGLLDSEGQALLAETALVMAAAAGSAAMADASADRRDA